MSQRASTNEGQLVAVRRAYLQIQQDGVFPTELEQTQELEAPRRHLLPVRTLHLPAGPATPVPAETHIKNDILTSVPKSLPESVLTVSRAEMMTSLWKRQSERFIN